MRTLLCTALWALALAADEPPPQQTAAAKKYSVAFALAADEVPPQQTAAAKKYPVPNVAVTRAREKWLAPNGNVRQKKRTVRTGKRRPHGTPLASTSSVRPRQGGQPRRYAGVSEELQLRRKEHAEALGRQIFSQKRAELEKQLREQNATMHALAQYQSAVAAKRGKQLRRWRPLANRTRHARRAGRLTPRHERTSTLPLTKILLGLAGAMILAVCCAMRMVA
jgi:hypothetical protein